MNGARRLIQTGVACALVVTGCAAIPDDPDAPSGDDDRVGASVSRVCFVGALRDFDRVDDESLILRLSESRQYLVRTTFCPALERAQGLRIGGQAQCLQDGDRIEVFDTRFPRQGAVSDRPNICTVTAINEWTANVEQEPEQ